MSGHKGWGLPPEFTPEGAARNADFPGQEGGTCTPCRLGAARLRPYSKESPHGVRAPPRADYFAAAERATTQSTMAASLSRLRQTRFRNSAGRMSWVLKKFRSPPQEYIRLAGSSPRSLALAFGSRRGSQVMPFTASVLPGIFASSRTVVDGLPCWT